MTQETSLDLPDNQTCAFCAYLKGQRPYTILYRTDQTATFVTREQRDHPHLLVLPLRHVPSLLELTDGEVAAVAIEVRNAAILIEQAYAKSGIAVWQNNGVPAGQAISHVHFHVAGTLLGGGTDFGAVRELSVAETDALSRRLLNHSHMGPLPDPDR